MCGKSLVCGPARAESPTSPEPRATPWVPCPHSLRPVRAKVKANRSPILLPLQGVGVYTLIPRALPWAVNWLPFQGAGGGFELIEFLQRGRGAAPQFDVGLRRRNNELNELTNCRAAWVRGIAPERGSYSRGVCQNSLILKNHKAPTFTSQGFAMSKSCCTFRQKIFNYGKVTLSFL